MKLFHPIRIGTLTIPNRIAKSAMVEGRCTHRGEPTEALAALYEEWSRGGTGLLIMGMAHVLEGWSLPKTELGLYTDDHIPALRRVADAVHRSESKVFAQLCHAAPQILRAKARRLGSVSASAGFNRTNLLFDREIREDELLNVVRGFGAAARRARDAGLDGVQVHAAHGYLLSRLISPLHNHRRDAWGNGLEGRISILKAIRDSIRADAGADFPLTIKLNAHDGRRGGLQLADAIEIARRLEDWGYDAIEVSAGTGDVGMGFFPNKGGVPVDLGKRFLERNLPILRPIIPFVDPVLKLTARGVRFESEAYFLDEAVEIAKAVRIPVLTVGGIRTLATANRIIEETPVSMVSLARPLVRQPNLPMEWRAGGEAKARCTSCNRCFVRVGLDEPLRCDARSAPLP